MSAANSLQSAMPTYHSAVLGGNGSIRQPFHLLNVMAYIAHVTQHTLCSTLQVVNEQMHTSVGVAAHQALEALNTRQTTL